MRTRWMFGSLLIGALIFSLVSCSDDTVEPTDSQVPDQGIDGPIPDKKLPPDMGCTLTVAKINTTDATKVTAITAADDQDTSTKGIQIDITVNATGLADKSTVSLTVTGLSKALDETVSSGEAVFKSVTVANTIKQLVLKASATGCKSSQMIFTVKPEPECTFVAPLDGASLGKNDDKDPSNFTFDYDVKVATVNATGGTVALTVDSTKVGTQNVGAAGLAAFANSVLPEGTGKVLEAEVTVGGITRKCKATVSVNLKGLTCKVTFGKAPVDLTATLGKYGFGLAQNASTSATGLEVDITVTTSTNSTGVILLLDGSSTKKTTTTTGSATFSGIPIPDGDHTIEATCMETGTTNSGSSGKIKALVDTVAPPPVDVKSMALKMDDLRQGKVCLNWTSVGDNAKGSGMSTYNIRYRTDKEVTDTNWSDSATTAAVTDLAAYPKGAYQEKCLMELPLGFTYYISIRSKDKVGNTSAKVCPFNSVMVDFTSQTRTGITGAKAWGAVTASGDFNCDGFADLAVGNPDEGTNNEGAVYIYLGSKSGYLKSPEKVISGTVAKGQFGAGLASLASFDKDNAGCRDLAVLASHGKGSKAAVYFYFGHSKLFDRDDVSIGKGADVIYSLNMPGAFSHIAGIYSVGDLDNDLLSDLAVTYVDGDLTKGKAEVWIIYGSKQSPITSTQKPVAKTLPAAAGLQITGGKPTEMFGDSVAGGRLGYDQFQELLIGAPGKGTGAVYIIEGAARAATLPETVDITSTSKRVTMIAGGSSNGSFGTAVAFVGDMDNDGMREFAVSDPTTTSNTGTVYLFNTKKTPKTVADAVGMVTHDITGAVGDKFGSAMGDVSHFNWKTGADLTGDSLPDLVVATATTGSGNNGTVYLIKGAKTLTGLVTSKAYYAFTDTSSTNFGASVILAPDINGKNAKGVGYADIVVGDPGANSGVGQLHIYY